MKLKLMKDEVLQEMNAVHNFIKLAIACQKAGYLKAAQYYLAQAREDCEHSFLYARELDKYDELEADLNIVEITKKYFQMEFEAIDRIAAIREEAKSENVHGIYPFLTSLSRDHSEEAYRAKKLLQQVEILHNSEDMKSIEDLYEGLMDDLPDYAEENQ